jgi:hypothetical protein
VWINTQSNIKNIITVRWLAKSDCTVPYIGYTVNFKESNQLQKCYSVIVLDRFWLQNKTFWVDSTPWNLQCSNFISPLTFYLLIQGNKWVYNCLHAGLNYQDGIFEVPTFQCCKKCEFPGFSYCTRRYTAVTAQSRCNSEALRCISRCMNKKIGGTLVDPRARMLGRPRSQKCPTKRKKVGGSYCLERSCIRVWTEPKVVFWQNVDHYEARPKIWLI